ncbi:hypothetical protein BV898_14999 [Hypsibius exemplaris]|uniref:Uncharacterized protein n=1 Tax=Hypsibius exemplaris TaxID=2072580 RepID=A0A9X6NH23_HYPEX|nr:hypothetical protein BV898_14999 [Hypsibius exemplaris]
MVNSGGKRRWTLSQNFASFPSDTNVPGNNIVYVAEWHAVALFPSVATTCSGLTPSTARRRFRVEPRQDCVYCNEDRLPIVVVKTTPSNQPGS